MAIGSIWGGLALAFALAVATPALAQFNPFGFNPAPPPQPVETYRQRPVRPPPEPAYGYRRAPPPEVYYAPPPQYRQAPPPGYPGYYPGRPVYTPYPEAVRPQPYYREERARLPRGYEERRSYEDRRGLEEREVRRPDAEPRRRRARVAPVVPQPAEKKPEIEPSVFVVTFGDSLAKQLSDGLDEAYEEVDEVMIEDRARADGALVRLEGADPAKTIQDFLATNPKITVAVMQTGAAERQAIREGDAVHEPLSERWRELYRDRVDAVIRVFAERKIPLVWVGAPPLKNEKASEDAVNINELVRARVQRAGAVYVDIWPAFVTEDNRYAATGPDFAGQTARLRTADGVHFTAAGARKAAHFVQVELKRIIEQKGVAVAGLPAATPAQGAPGAGSADQLINAAVPALPEPDGLPSIAKPRPLAGPVVPLTRPEVSPGGALVTGAPKLEGDAAQTVERALRQGVPPPPKPGRADDFSWPPKS
jgi:hypothetical protein